MPGGIGGHELALAARRQRPGIQVLLMSGYSEQAVAVGLPADCALLEKAVSETGSGAGGTAPWIVHRQDKQPMTEEQPGDDACDPCGCGRPWSWHGGRLKWARCRWVRCCFARRGDRRGWNQPISACDPTAHAEVLALRAAAARLGNYRLVNSTLYLGRVRCAPGRWSMRGWRGWYSGPLIHAAVRWQCV